MNKRIINSSTYQYTFIFFEVTFFRDREEIRPLLRFDYSEIEEARKELKMIKRLIENERKQAG